MWAVANILYPTRGGDTTYRNQDRAAALAKERGETLLLLYISNVHFLDHTAGPVHMDLVQKELDELGEFLLALAQERAQNSGVKAETLVLHGEFRQALRQMIREYEIAAVVLGRPAHDKALTTVEYISQIAQSITKDLGVEAFVVHEGEFVEHYQPQEKTATP